MPQSTPGDVDPHADFPHNGAVTTYPRIAQFGFHPEIVSDSLDSCLAEVDAMVCQMEADLDKGEVFRHFTVVAVGSGLLAHVHVDEEDGGRVAVTSSVIPLATVLAVHVRRVVAPGRAGEPPVTDEVTIEVNHQENRRTDIEPVRCKDPNCTADHGYSAVTSPEDLMLRFTSAADGAAAVAEADHFARTLSRAVAVRA